MFYEDKEKHLLLHALLLICNVSVQQLVNGMHSLAYHFSLSPQVRIFDTLICYSLMLMFVYVYLKLTRCKVKSLVYYAVMGVLPCIITALGLEWLEFWGGYENEYCSDFGGI